ncbi:unnamed protein product [Urochloa humidicola]
MKRRSPPSTGGASPRSPLRRQCVAGGKVPWDSCFSPRLMIHKQQAMAGRWHHGSPMSGIYKAENCKSDSAFRFQYIKIKTSHIKVFSTQIDLNCCQNQTP